MCSEIRKALDVDHTVREKKHCIFLSNLYHIAFDPDLTFKSSICVKCHNVWSATRLNSGSATFQLTMLLLSRILIVCVM